MINVNDRWNEFYKKISQIINRLDLRKQLSPTDREDIIQDCMVKILEHEFLYKKPIDNKLLERIVNKCRMSFIRQRDRNGTPSDLNNQDEPFSWTKE